MSDPVTNVEIEDLLSSVRRLVAGAEGAKDKTAVLTDRLVLTPALRVDDPISNAGSAPTEEAAEAEAAAPKEPEPSTQTLVLPPEAATAPASPQDRHAALEATIAELEAAVLKSRSEWEPDGSEAAPAAAVWPDEQANAPDSVAETQPEDSPQAEPEPAEDETALDTQFAADEGAFAAEAEPEEMASPAPTFDEEELRALILEVLRDELRGPMGERITGNMRKLVRREIYRVLALEDLKT